MTTMHVDEHEGRGSEEHSEGPSFRRAGRRRGWPGVALVSIIASVAVASHFSGRFRASPDPARPEAVGASAPREAAGHAANDRDPRRVPGLIEAIPRNVFHASPYNDWPLFELRVHEGQRLRFRREEGRWVGDQPGLFIQYETPAEIDTKKEEVELADLEERSATLARDVLREEMQKELEAAEIRETNARQQFERLDRLRGMDQASVTAADLDRARNMLALARTQREQLARLLGKKVEMAKLQADLADRRARKARSELDLADFKREMSWAKVPVAKGRFEEVVVTKVQAVRGDSPGAGGKRDVWVEVVDDRSLQARVLVPLERAERLAEGAKARVSQGRRSYDGRVLSVGAVADRPTRLIPVLVTVENHDRGLRINTEVTVDFSPEGGRGR